MYILTILPEYFKVLYALYIITELLEAVVVSLIKQLVAVLSTMIGKKLGHCVSKGKGRVVS